MATAQISPEIKPRRKFNRRWALILTVFTVCVVIAIIVILTVILTTNNDSSPMPKIQAEYQEKANKIIRYCTVGEGSGRTHEWVANISDLFGPRKIGTENLENAIDYNLDHLKNEYGFENVHGENAYLPNWQRGEEWAYLESPRRKSLAILGLGTTVGTDGKNLTAEAVVVVTWEELQARCNLTADQGVKGKIVVYNEPWSGYGKSAAFRSRGASEASKCGAVAALIRSASSMSINSPHTGSQSYARGIKKIPAISLASEDAELLYRMQMRGQKLRVTIFISSQNLEKPIVSRNTIFDLPGSTRPNEIIMISGHFDSWDVGAGAMDNGGGAGVALMAIANLKSLIDQKELPPPKRTIRGIFWTAEEPGLLGSQQYYYQHKNDTNTTYVFLQEADEGFFRPLQLAFSGSIEARTTFQDQIFPLVKPLLNTSLVIGAMGDSDWWASEGIPGVSLYSSGEGYERYFSFHHSQGDTPSVYNSKDLDAPTAVWAVLAYVLADMDEALPVGPRVR